MEKILFEGVIISVQPRIRLLRSFDQGSHSYLGYALIVADRETEEELSIGIGMGSQEKHQFRVGMTISGSCSSVLDPDVESVEYYRVSKLKVLDENPVDTSFPPWKIVPPPIPIYRQRGPRRLSARTYESKCTSCIWGCRMAVEIIIDQWNPRQRKYRKETFCYGPKSCKLYASGPTRKVPGRKGMVYEEEPWVDEMLTSHRDDDE
ncbi:MAG TPA: hypothetical protein VJ863_03705 [Sphaerochaeta sp.]|nr:hypothetical protein [Sphaerochaeta sp.]